MNRTVAHATFTTFTTFAAIVLVASGALATPPDPAKPAPGGPGVSDATLGLEKSPITSVPVPRPFAYGTKDPGDGALLPRPFPSAPPLIPHTVEGLLPIARTDNGCLGCHAAATSATQAKGDPVPIPASHFVDLRNAPAVKRAEIAGTRYVCTACHVPQSDARPLVKNRFSP